MTTVLVTAIIAAGGKASRLGSRTPKSLLLMHGRPLIQYVVDELHVAGIRSIVVLAESAAVRRELTRELNGKSGVVVAASAEVGSTLEVCRVGASLSKSTRIYFAYGHTPVPASHILKVIEQQSRFVGTAVRSSTRKDLIQLEQELFLEPPFVFDRALLAGTSSTWSQLYSLCPEAVIIPSDESGEFNDENELALLAARFEHFLPLGRLARDRRQ
jgi:CTP:molybdopterin cytidylyltransferase MocA